jgi:hypothetical protein
VRIAITVSTVTLLRDFGLYGIIYVTSVFTSFDFPVILDGQFTPVLYSGGPGFKSRPGDRLA